MTLFIYYHFIYAEYYQVLPSFPTRRSSDLPSRSRASDSRGFPRRPRASRCSPSRPAAPPRARRQPRDRKSTRLNSSHVEISYAVVCLKKKKLFGGGVHGECGGVLGVVSG